MSAPYSLMFSVIVLFHSSLCNEGLKCYIKIRKATSNCIKLTDESVTNPTQPVVPNTNCNCWTCAGSSWSWWTWSHTFPDLWRLPGAGFANAPCISTTINNRELKKKPCRFNIFHCAITHQYDILLKCSVNWVSCGDRMSHCSWAQISTSGISIFWKSSASSNVIWAAMSEDLRSSSVGWLVTIARLVRMTGLVARYLCCL